MTTATQDVEDFLKNEYGKAVLTNSSIQILLKQGTAEVDMIADTFYLSEGEKALLLSSDVGEGLFFAGQNHVAMKVFAAPFEHELITSNPMELLKRQEAKEASDKQDQAEQATEVPATPQITTDMNQILNTPSPAASPVVEPQSQPVAPAVTQPEPNLAASTVAVGDLSNPAAPTTTSPASPVLPEA